MKNLEQSKQQALANYKEKRIAYIENMTNENWIAFCEAKEKCMMLGVRI